MKPGDRVLFQDRHCRHSDKNPKGWRIGTVTAVESKYSIAIDGKWKIKGDYSIVPNPENEAKLRYAMIQADVDFAEGIRLAERARDARYRIAIDKWCKGEEE